MVFENYLLGILFLIIGLVFRFFPPRKINSFYGYRTRQSMQNQSKWDFAQQRSANYLILLGVTITLSALIFQLLPGFERQQFFIQLGIMLLGIVYIFWDVERRLKGF